jgi:hypothetical protein
LFEEDKEVEMTDTTTRALARWRAQHAGGDGPAPGWRRAVHRAAGRRQRYLELLFPAGDELSGRAAA